MLSCQPILQVKNRAQYRSLLTQTSIIDIILQLTFRPYSVLFPSHIPYYSNLLFHTLLIVLFLTNKRQKIKSQQPIPLINIDSHFFCLFFTIWCYFTYSTLSTCFSVQIPSRNQALCLEIRLFYAYIRCHTFPTHHMPIFLQTLLCFSLSVCVCVPCLLPYESHETVLFFLDVDHF